MTEKQQQYAMNLAREVGGPVNVYDNGMAAVPGSMAELWLEERHHHMVGIVRPGSATDMMGVSRPTR